MILLILCAGFAVSAGLSTTIERREADRTRIRFEQRATAMASAIERTFDRQIDILYAMDALRPLITGSEGSGITPATIEILDAYARGAVERNPGVAAITFTPVLPDFVRVMFEANGPAMGFPQVTITDLHSGELGTAARRPEYFPVVSLQPLEGTQALWGFDLGSDPAARAAMDKARDSAAVTVSGRLHLPGNEADQWSVVFLLPVYNSNHLPTSVEERRALHFGFIGEVVHLDRFFRSAVLPLGETDLQVSVDDLTGDPAAAALVRYTPDGSPLGSSSQQSEGAGTEQTSWSSRLIAGDRQWLLRFSPTASYLAGQHSWTSDLAFGGGVLLTGLLAAYLAVSARRTARIAALAIAREQEIGERKRAEAALHQREERFRALVEHSADLIAVIDREGTTQDVSPAAEMMLGFRPQSRVGTPFADLIHPDDLAAFDRTIAEAGARPGTEQTLELRLQHAGGRWISVEAVCRDLLADPNVGGIVINARDVSERKRYEAQLVHLATRDGLTGLYNRRRFEEEVERQLAHTRRFGGQGALLFLDLDGFKRVNDTLGHRAGDELLTSLAEVIAATLRETDVLARLGGDEFAVLLPQTSAEQAEAAARRLVAGIREHTLLTRGQPVRSTASVGIACFPAHGDSVESLLAASDLAMYQAKEQHDNVCLYRPEQNLQAEMGAQRLWEERIRAALVEDSFILFAQPIRTLASDATSYEVLIRMQGPNGEIIPPSEFLPAAERSGLIRAIDRWVVRQAIHLIAGQQRAGVDLSLAVNLSGKSFDDIELWSLIETELRETGIAPDRLILEITETAAIADMAQAMRCITMLKRLGCRFALDDFGVGFSSFYYLKHLPVDHIKIDGSFIRNLANDTGDQHLVRAMVEVARGLGKQTVAEFVGDADTANLLRGFGVDQAQGFFIGMPLPIADVLVPAEESAARAS